MEAKNNSVSILDFCAWFKNVAFKLCPKSLQAPIFGSQWEKNLSMNVEFALDKTKQDALHKCT